MTSPQPRWAAPHARAHASFARCFSAPAAMTVLAPGRVNLIGEHTDYNDGFVLPCAINYGTVIALRPRTDAIVRVVAADYDNALDQFSLDEPIRPRADRQWPNYVRGTVRELWAEGVPLRGCDLAIAGNVPQGAGLSSSASLEVAVAEAFRHAHALELTPTRMAQLAQRAENDFVGCKCGIMDQLISARGQPGHALLIDCRSLEVRPVPIPDSLAVVIVDSKVQRGLVGSEYNTRRVQCEQAARHYGVSALRDVSLARLMADADGLDPLVFRRARHIVTDNDRALQACEALAANDMPRMSALMSASHASMRDDFEITVPAIDHLAALLQSVIGTSGGARMTGGGFGGCVVALMPEAMVTESSAAVQAHYRSPNGQSATVHVCRASAGAARLD